LPGEIEMDEEIKKAAFEKYGECIGHEWCVEFVESYLIETFGVSKEEAAMYRKAAFEEWVEAYCG